MVRIFVALALLVAPAMALAQSPAVDAAWEAAGNYDRDGARTILEEACAENDGAACTALLATLDASYDDGDEKAARALATRLCEGGDIFSCVILTRYADQGKGGDIDQSLQRASAITACRGGIFSACSVASDLAQRGIGGPQDVELSQELVRIGCDGDHAVSCQFNANDHLNAGWAADDDAKANAEWQQARSLYQKGCSLGDAYSCTAYGELLAEGRGGEVDRDAARASFAIGCRMDIYQCEPGLRAERPGN